MRTFAGEQGRTFIMRLDQGDLLLESIQQLAEKEKIYNGVICSGIATFDEVNIQMTNTLDYPIGYVVHNLREPIELGALNGTIINQEPHIHGVIGNGEHTWTGHLSKGCRILYLAEVVIQEVKGLNLIRRANQNGVFQINEL